LTIQGFELRTLSLLGKYSATALIDLVYFWDRLLLAFCPGWLGTSVLPSPSPIHLGFTGMSDHTLPVSYDCWLLVFFWDKVSICSLGWSWTHSLPAFTSHSWDYICASLHPILKLSS
jgi:hypothetical protein